MTARFSVLVVALAVLATGCGTTTPSPSGSSATPGLTVAASVTPTIMPTPSATALGTPGPIAADWPLYHLDAGRTGNQLAFPTFSGSLSEAWTAKLDGAVYAEPLVVDEQVIVATENDSVYAVDPASGSILWRQHLGTPVRLSTLPCGDIDPLGITGTPAFDPATGSLYLVGELAGPHHVLFALDPSTGSVRWSRDVDLAGDTPITHQQRPALAVANGYVYIGFGGLYGDCGQYIGEVVGVPTSGAGDTIAYRVPVTREGAVWATAGPVIDASGNVYVATGNGSSTTTYDGSDSVLELSPGLKLLSRFAPSTWTADNAGDADLGSTSPVLVPGGWVFQVGKSGTGYVLRQGALGGIGGQVSSAYVCSGFGGAAQDGATIYVPCQRALREVQVGTDGKLTVGWITKSGVGGGPPVIGGGAIWSLNVDGGRLYALDPATGGVLASISVGSLPHFASPTLWGGWVLIGTMSGVVAVKA
ncbi:MAG TPA: PQQ-binding-like beta-propeller repeat protein [Candidatus Limnocylindrales bacterium]|jgi:outer membrane protein assembly factor BamB